MNDKWHKYELNRCEELLKLFERFDQQDARIVQVCEIGIAACIIAGALILWLL